jgi:N-hydroxyarylamine O-acetyltransferase
MTPNTLDDTTIDRYLHRVGLQRSDISLDYDGLAQLQYAHLTTVPFTNLDVYERRAVTTSLDWSLPAVLNGRGGWCFVLNGAFAALLEGLGFPVTRYAALVMYGDVSPMDDHLCLRVDLDRPWLVDVGFGESFTRPMPLDSDDIIDDVAAGRRFRLTRGTDGRRQLESEHEVDGTPSWRLDYRFSETPRSLSDFAEASEYLCTTPGLMWTEKRFTTRLTDDGRVTLLHDRIKYTPVWGDELVEELADDDAWEQARQRQLPTPR